MLTPITPDIRLSLVRILKNNPDLTGLYEFITSLKTHEINAAYFETVAEACDCIAKKIENNGIRLKRDTMDSIAELYGTTIPALEALITILYCATDLPIAAHIANLKKLIVHFVLTNLHQREMQTAAHSHAFLIYTPFNLINEYHFDTQPLFSTEKESHKLAGLSIQLNTYLEAMMKQQKHNPKENHEDYLRLIIETRKIVKRLKKAGVTSWAVDYCTKNVGTLLSRLGREEKPSKYSHPHLFDDKDIHDYKERLACAKAFFYDWDDTVFQTAYFDEQTKTKTPIAAHEAFFESTQALIKLIDEFGYHQQFIITARHHLYEQGPKTIHAYSVDETGANKDLNIYAFHHSTPLFPTLEQIGLSETFSAKNVIFCDFEYVVEIAPNILKRYQPMAAARETKNRPYEIATDKADLDRKQCVIFDDSATAWESSTVSAHHYLINNESPYKHQSIDFAIGRTFAQTLLYNKDISLDKRRTFAARLIALFSEHQLEVLITPRLKKFAIMAAPKAMETPTVMPTIF